MTDDQRGPFAHIIEAQAAKMRRAARVRHLHTDVQAVLAEALAGADYRHELAGADPSDRDGMYRFVSNVLLHAHDRARADLPDITKGPLRVAVVAPMWVTTALPWFKREEVGRSPNFEWVPLWEDPCADVWHLIALAGVDESGAELAPSVLLDNYQWVGAYPAPTFHAGMGPHEPCGPTCTGNDHNRSERNTDA